MEYKRCGRSGLKLPRIALGLWQNFDWKRRSQTRRRFCVMRLTAGSHTLTSRITTVIRRMDLRRKNFGQALKDCPGTYRDELVISTKAGYDMWPGPYGNWGSRKYLMASLDQSLKRMGLDYVDIFTTTDRTRRRLLRRQWVRSVISSAAEKHFMSDFPTIKRKRREER